MATIKTAPMMGRFVTLLLTTLLLASLASPRAYAVPALPTPPKAPILNGLVLLARPDQMAKKGWSVALHGVDATRVPNLGGGRVDRALKALLGKPITAALLDRIRVTIEKGLRAGHYPFASVSIPVQPVNDGVMQVLVIESRLGKVAVTGAHYFSADQYRAALHIQPGDEIDMRKVVAATDAINANQYRHAVIVASPGAKLGTTDLTIRAQDRLPLTFFAGIDNTGNDATSLYRATFGVNWGNAFWRGDDLNYQFSASPDFSELREHSLTYTTHLPWGDTLTLSGLLANSNTAATGPISTSGRTINASVRYIHTLAPIGRAIEHLTVGYDFKSTNNNILFGGVSVFPTTTQIDQFMAGLDIAAPDKYGSTSASLQLFVSPGDITPRNTDVAFATQQAGAKAEYVYARFTLNRLTALPGRLTWYTGLTAQVSDGILLPSEQLAFGGVQSVRGYEEYSATRDEGVVMQNELRAPPIATGIGRLLGLGRDSLTLFVFVDAGAGRNHTEFPGSPGSSIELISSGPGMTWQFASHVNVRFSWGLPVLRRGQYGQPLGPQFAVNASF